MENGKNLAQEEREKHRSSDLARIFFSILVLFISRKIEVINYLMGFHLFISLIWIIKSERNPLFQKNFQYYWLIPASLDVLNCLMIIYVTGSAYSSWILALTFITAIAAPDQLKWRGLFTGLAGSIGLALMLVFVQLGILPFIDVWKINYRPHSWSLVVQAIALNAGVTFFVWYAIHGISTITNEGRSRAEKDRERANTILDKLFPNSLSEKIQEGEILEYEFASILSVQLSQEGEGQNPSDPIWSELRNSLETISINHNLKTIETETELFLATKLSNSRSNSVLLETIKAALEIVSLFQSPGNKKKDKSIRVRIGICTQKLWVLDSHSSNPISIPFLDNPCTASRVALFKEKDGIYVSEEIYETLQNAFLFRLEGKMILKNKSSNIYSLQKSKSGKI